MNNEKILAHVRMFVLREKLLCPGEPLHLAAAVSGGADSMALLRILLALQPEFGFVLSACHVNHGLRGETADRDEAFVRAECARLGVPLRVFHAAEMADEVGLPSEHAGEDWARRLRYACFARLCGEGIDVVATAHTANDQAETLLLRLARGTGLHGAAGIRPKRGCYLRPLLALTRQDTESFCRAAGQAWVTDETNATDAYARNRVRRAALPALQSTNGAAAENLARFCEKAARADAYFARKAEELLSAARLDAAQAAIKSPEACTVWRLGPLSDADVRALLDGGEKVLLFAHHHQVMDIYKQELKAFSPGFITGRETTLMKMNAVDRFQSGRTDVLCISLRAASGLNLQRATCVVFGELDWSPAVHSQAEDRAHRMGQEDSLLCYYLVAPQGSDAVMQEALGLKVSQFVGLMGDAPQSPEQAEQFANQARRHVERIVAQMGDNSGSPG